MDLKINACRFNNRPHLPCEHVYHFDKDNARISPLSGLFLKERETSSGQTVRKFLPTPQRGITIALMNLLNLPCALGYEFTTDFSTEHSPV